MLYFVILYNHSVYNTSGEKGCGGQEEGGGVTEGKQLFVG